MSDIPTDNMIDDTPIQRHRKPRADIYTVLLVLALLALIVGLVCLYLEMDAYEFKLDGGPRVTCTPSFDTFDTPTVVRRLKFPDNSNGPFYCYELTLNDHGLTKHG